MKISSAGIDLIQRFESCRFQAYQDEKGVWTIGWGHTGPDVHEGDRITEDRADELLDCDLDWAERAVRHNVSVIINQHEFDALVSLVFNIGPSAFSSSTLLRLLNSREPRAPIAAEFMRWVKIGDKVSEGLRLRRAAEMEWFLTPVEDRELKESLS
jgi:lysozyme